MLTGKQALASMLLCFICMLDLTLQSVVKLCSQDIIRNVQILIDKGPNSGCLDCRLYTPTIHDYKKCPSSTMRCFADEIDVLIKEWTTIPYRGFKLYDKLRDLASKLNQTESQCLKCELLKEKNAETFLKDLHMALEMMNTEHC